MAKPFKHLGSLTFDMDNVLESKSLLSITLQMSIMLALKNETW